MKALSPFLAATLLFSPFPSSASPLRDCRDGCDRDHPPGSGRLADGTTLRRLCREDCRLSYEALVGRTWAVMRYATGSDGVAVLVPEPPGDGPTFVLTPGGHLSLYSGCNTLSAPYGGFTGSMGGGTFEVLPGGVATRRGCPGDLGRQEDALFGFLAAGTVGWAVGGAAWPGGHGGTALFLGDPETGDQTMELLLLEEEDESDEDGGSSDRAADARDGADGADRHRKRSGGGPRAAAESMMA